LTRWATVSFWRWIPTHAVT